MAQAPTEATFDASPGLKIFYRTWRPTGRPRAVVVICHGVNSHSGQYFWPAEQFVESDLAVYAVDLRGRGKSDGARFYIDNVAEYVSDLASLIKIAKSREPGLPVFLLGHSAGGVVGATYTLDNQAELAGFICESFAFRVPAPKIALSILKLLSSFAPRLPTLKLKNQDFSRNPRAVEILNADRLTANEAQPAKTMAALIRADERLEREFPRITIPVFILHGTADKATVPAGSQFFYDTVGSADKTLKLYDGHFHDLLNDEGRERVMADMKEWIAKRIPGASA